MNEPYCLAMVVCDGIHRDPGTGKYTLLGTFSSFATKAFPARVRFVVYFAITDGLGPTDVRLQLVNANAGAIDAYNDDDISGRIFCVGTEIDIANPLVVIESHLGIETELPEAGLYHCELWANRTLLMSRRFTAIHLEHDK